LAQRLLHDRDSAAAIDAAPLLRLILQIVRAAIEQRLMPVVLPMVRTVTLVRVVADQLAEHTPIMGN
jgi:hypothetical protein